MSFHTIEPVQLDATPADMAQISEKLIENLRYEHQVIREEIDPERAISHLETLSESVMVLASMVHALALGAARTDRP